MTLQEISLLLNDIYIIDEKTQKTKTLGEFETLQELEKDTQKFDFEHFITKSKTFLIILKNKNDIYIKNAKNELVLGSIMKAVAGKQILAKENEIFKEDNCCFVNSENLKNIIENDLTGDTTSEIMRYLATTDIKKILILDEDLIDISKKIFQTKNNSKENLEKNIYISEIIQGNISLLQAHSITEIEKNMLNKKALWKELQVIFEI